MNRTVTIFCWFASSLSAWIKFSQSPCGTACAKNLGFIFSCAELHYQNPVGRPSFMSFSKDCTPPTAVLLSGRYPPNIVLQRKTVTMRADVPPLPPTDAMIRLRKSVLSLKISHINVQLLLLPLYRKLHVLFPRPIQMTSLFLCILLINFLICCLFLRGSFYA